MAGTRLRSNNGFRFSLESHKTFGNFRPYLRQLYTFVPKSTNQSGKDQPFVIVAIMKPDHETYLKQALSVEKRFRSRGFLSRLSFPFQGSFGVRLSNSLKSRPT